MNYNKRFKGQVDLTLTQNVLSNPLVGITTTFDGAMVEGSGRFMLGFSSNSIGIAGTNIGIICQPFQVYDYPFNQIRQLGIFTTESGNNVSFIIYDEEN